MVEAGFYITDPTSTTGREQGSIRWPTINQPASKPALLYQRTCSLTVGQCLDRRIPDKATLIKEIAAWEHRRNTEKARIEWVFTVERAREKLGRVYPKPTGHAIKAAA